jgi:PAS domain S-box-containing protein
MMFEIAKRFLRSKSGRAFLLHLGLCAILSAAVGAGFYYSSLNWFVAHKSDEKLTALRLVDAFVTNYSSLRTQFGPNAPVPATFRAHAIETFNKLSADDAFMLRMVGRPGRQIKTAPTDASMAAAIDAFAGETSPQAKSDFLTAADGQVMFRTIYPSVAREQSCVNCHNQLQPNAGWRLNDVMGAFAIDVPVSPFLRANLMQSLGLGFALFLALGIVGLVVARQHFRQMEEREAATAEIGRARKFLDSVVENIPALVTVKNAGDERYVLVNRSAEDYLGVSRDVMLGKRLQDIFPADIAGLLRERDLKALQSRDIEIIEEHDVSSGRADARVLSTKKLIIPDEAGAPRYLLSLSEDITHRKEAEAKIAHMAHHDALTHLPNRVSLSEQLNTTLAAARGAGESFAVLCVDLDRLKEVNDIFGHPVGDGLLRAVATRLTTAAEARSSRASAVTNSRSFRRADRRRRPPKRSPSGCMRRSPATSMSRVTSCAPASASALRSIRRTALRRRRCSPKRMPRSTAPRPKDAAERASSKSRWTRGCMSGGRSSMNCARLSRATSWRSTISRKP